MPQTSTSFTFEQIAVIRSPYREKFGIPRQPRLANKVTAVIELAPHFNHPDTIAALEQFSHLWIVFVFHKCADQGWKNKVRPPRLGGNKKIGVFASRSPFRPNPIGMSAVKIVEINNRNNKTTITVQGADLLEGTPVLDIKPYVPYSDAIADATSQLASEFSPLTQDIHFSEQTQAFCQEYANQNGIELNLQIEQILRCDPRPAYHNDPEKIYGLALHQLNIRFSIGPLIISVIEISYL